MGERKKKGEMDNVRPEKPRYERAVGKRRDRILAQVVYCTYDVESGQNHWEKVQVNVVSCLIGFS